MIQKKLFLSQSLEAMVGSLWFVPGCVSYNQFMIRRMKLSIYVVSSGARLLESLLLLLHYYPVCTAQRGKAIVLGVRMLVCSQKKVDWQLRDRITLSNVTQNF